MNKKEHLFFNSCVYGLISNIFLFIFLYQYGIIEILITLVMCQVVFMIGAILPDFDHHKVLDKYWWAFWKRWVHHRGHWHSIGAALIYSLLVGFPMFFIVGLNFSIIIAFGAYLGYYSHLFADSIRSLKTGSKTVWKKWW